MEICFKIDTPNLPSGAAEDIKTILNNQSKIMAAIDDLKTQVTGLQTQVTDLQTALDNEQAQIQQLLDTNASVVTDLNNQIATLQGQISAGATPEQLQELADSLTTISQNIATTKEDLEGTVPDSTGNPGTGTEPTV
jgi:predicted  nucleic acid-binding Zn-ribbon protein